MISYTELQDLFVGRVKRRLADALEAPGSRGIDAKYELKRAEIEFDSLIVMAVEHGFYIARGTALRDSIPADFMPEAWPETRFRKWHEEHGEDSAAHSHDVR
ncbi:hypothetical protein [Couchioplanes caeruleus]|uniref:Uncharacterized protein n=2 Tax=Couchioplanes caeruleus TaxID=56438 RepID=A0A1K0FPB7_9ACTN|nr:hypothetical protein [Couchioplanes caeruleus]OJF14552.1 hypothetical protein BG844_09485 [Couchioplanes caeruleus subsp. caeruleus]ROP21287.1 hypothetical protein EDD30_7685 [Couchioplanes caeruleus]